MSENTPSHAGTLVFLLSQVGAECARRFAERLAPLGLTARAYGVLSQLHGDDRQTQQQLADRLGIHRNNMVAIIDELEASGWVRRHRSDRDRRAFEIHLTARGAAVVRKVLTQVELLEQEATAALSPAESAASIACLLRIAATLGLSSGVHPNLGAAPASSARSQ